MSDAMQKVDRLIAITMQCEEAKRFGDANWRDLATERESLRNEIRALLDPIAASSGQKFFPARPPSQVSQHRKRRSS